MEVNRTPVSECEAGRKNRQALHAIRLQKGNGEWNLNQIEHILTGEEPCEAERISE